MKLNSLVKINKKKIRVGRGIGKQQSETAVCAQREVVTKRAKLIETNEQSRQELTLPRCPRSLSEIS